MAFVSKIASVVPGVVDAVLIDVLAGSVGVETSGTTVVS